MADPLSIAGAAVGVISLAIQGCQGLVQYYGSWKDSENNIAKMIASTETLVKMLKSLRVILEEETFSDQVREAVEESVRGCATAVGELNVEIVKVRKSDKTTLTGKTQMAVRRLSYPFRESTLFKLQKIIADMRENLLLAVEILQLHTTSINTENMHKLQAEVEQVGRSVASIDDNIESLRAQQLEQENQVILDWLSPLNFRSVQIDTLSRRQDGTGKWLFESLEYQAWAIGETPTLWCYGPPGAGKTVLASATIESLNTVLAGGDKGLAYVYCNHKDQGSQSVSEIMASLVQQLSRQQYSVPETVRELYRVHRPSRTRPVLVEWVRVLRSIVTDFANVYIVIDALDECYEADGTRKRLVEELRRTPDLHVLYTSRFLGDIAQMLQSAVKLEVRATDEDITRFLDCRISQENDLMGFCEKDPSLYNDIIQKVVKQADGMFLLAQLHIQSLARKITLKRARASLDNLPETLDEIYDEAMERIRTQDHDRCELAYRLLCWIIYAFEPMNLEAIQHALLAMSLDSDLGSVDDEDYPASHLLITVCAGLVVIDEESNVIRLVHHTTQEYFDRRRRTIFPSAQLNITQACVKYLLQPVFVEGPCSTEIKLIDRNHEYGFFKYAASHWGNHARGAPESNSGPLILALLNNELSLASLVQEMVDENYVHRGLDQAYVESVSALCVAASFGLVTVASFLISRGAGIMGRGSDGSTALHHAVWGGHVETSKVIIQNKADVNAIAIVDGIEQSVLQGAAARGYSAVVHLLLEHGAKVHFADANGRTALHHAAQNGHEEVVGQLVQFGADIQAVDRIGETAMSKANKHGHEKVIRVLSGHWKDQISATRQSCMLLQYAANSGDNLLFERVVLELRKDAGLLKDK